MTPEAFRQKTGVSRETLARLETYLALLTKWNRAINLVGRGTLDDPWRRHMLDSAQLYPLLPAGARRVADMGSGAGFPGMVLAIMGAPDVHLIEADRRKAAFLREVARATGTPVTLHTDRLESAPRLQADVVTARALAPLRQLLAYAQNLLAPGGLCLFLKGKNADTELTDAKSAWYIECDQVPSATNPGSSILMLRAFEGE